MQTLAVDPCLPWGKSTGTYQNQSVIQLSHMMWCLNCQQATMNSCKQPKGWQKAQEKHSPQVMPDVKVGKVAVYATDGVHLLEGDLISHLWGIAKADFVS